MTKKGFRFLSTARTMFRTILSQSGLLVRRVGLLLIFISLMTAIEVLTSSHIGWIRNTGIFMNFINAGFIVWYLMLLAKIYLWAPYEARHGRQAPRLFVNLVNILVVFMVLAFMTTVILDKDFGAIFAGLSFLGAGIALALQTPILDTFSGGVIDIERPMRLNDWIKIDGYSGKVVALNWRSTVIQNLDGYTHIPNAKFSTHTLTNYSTPNKNFLAHLIVSLDYHISIPRAQRILLSAVLSVPDVKDGSSATAFADKTTPGGIDYIVRFHVQDLARAPYVRHEVYSAIMTHLAVYGLSVSEGMGGYTLTQAPTLAEPFLTERPLQEALKSASLFHCLSKAQMTLLVNNVQASFINNGETVIAQGSKGDSMFVIEEGTVEVCINMSGKKDPVRVAILGPGACFGEMSLLTGEKRTATVRAMTSLRLIEIKKKALQPILQASPALLPKMAKVISQRQKINEEKKEKVVENTEMRQAPKKKTLLESMKEFFAVDDA